jgi:type IV secretion system protein VirB11
MASEAAPQLRHLLRPILHWLDDPATEEIAINQPGEAFVRQRGAFTRYDLPFGYDDLEDIAILAGALRRQDVGPRSPLCATELPGGERLQICLPPSVPNGTVSLTIRRPGTSVSALADVSQRYHTARWNKWDARRDTADRQNAESLAFYAMQATSKAFSRRACATA